MTTRRDTAVARRRAAVPAADAAAAVARLGRRWNDLRDARVFVSGGTGFVGTWLLATLCAANRMHGLNLRVVALSRDPAAFACTAPELAGDAAVELHAGDVRDFTWPAGRFTHVIHGAACSDAAYVSSHPAETRATIVDGTSRVLDMCRARGVARLLTLSSGAVYRQGGRRPLTEDDALCEVDPDDATRAYHHAKSRMESLALAAGASGGPAVTVARMFAFVGPLLPLDRHFAVGNFIADALAGGPVTVRGDGTPVRSYLYAADMAAWLSAALLDARPGRIYNVGAQRPVTIAETAALVAAAVSPPVEVRVLGASVGEGGGGAWYVPDTARARDELTVAAWTPLEEAVARTIAWHREADRS
jgi:nucleoside-diphosphate-sugar epimerase